MHATTLPAAPAPVPVLHIRERAVLTPRGTVAVQIIRLERALAELSPADRAWCLGMLRELVDGPDV